MKIYRFEITSDTSKPIKILEPGAKKWNIVIKLKNWRMTS